MNYELAKKLKDAGFPQFGEGHALIPNKPLPESEETMEKVSWRDFIRLNYQGEFVYAPTLSELISACGVHCEGLPVFKQLNWHAKRKTGKVETPQGLVDAEILGYWSVKARIGKEHIGHITEWGKTPEEAVAKLWLALNKKL